MLQAFPHLPVEEEGRLNDPRLRENFVERVFAYRRLRALFAGRWTVGRLVAFHTAHKLQLMAHSPRGLCRAGTPGGGREGAGASGPRASYEAQFMSALEVMATPKRHVNVLQHILGYFTDQLDSAARQELVELIDDYGRGMLPLVVPLTLVRHYVRQFAIAYLQAADVSRTAPQRIDAAEPRMTPDPLAQRPTASLR